MEENYASDESSFEDIFENLMSRELGIAKKIKPRKSDKELWLNEASHMLENQRTRVMDVARIRLVYLLLHGRLEKLQAGLREFDCLGPGFSMMDYEYLLKRRDVYTEKRDEQIESMKKLNKKNLCCGAVRIIFNF